MLRGGELVYQETDPSAANYLNNRRALVGPGCTVNSIFDGVQLVEGVKDLQNLCNDNLDDYAEMPGLANVVAGGSPIISVKDNQNYYAAETEAGFTICANSDGKLLSLNLATFYKIQFLCDGKPIGDLQSITNGQNITGVGLSLLTIPGNKMVNRSFVAKAPGMFNEIKLYQCGVDATVLSSINIKYAFVGKAHEYTITRNADNGISKYKDEQKRGSMTLSTGAYSPTDNPYLSRSSREKVIDADLTNGYVVQLGLVSTPVTVVAKASDGKEAFYAGTEVGFKYKSASLLNLGIGGGAKITLYDKDNKEIGTYIVSGTVLGLGVADSNDGELVVKAPKDFSSAKLEFFGLNVNVGEIKAYYAFVRMAPSPASHHCKIDASLDRNVGAYEKKFTLQSNAAVKVTWDIVSQPEGADVTLDKATGTVSDIHVAGDYKFIATAEDGCHETTTIHYAPEYKPADQGMTLLVNNDGHSAKYQLSDKFGTNLIQILSDRIVNRSAVLTSALSDFTYRIPNVALIGNTGIVGVKSVDGSCLAKDINGDRKVGFVVSSKTTGLNANVLKLYNIMLFNKGEKVMSGITTHWDAISAGLIGKEETHKMRLAIDVPAELVFDEVVLYNTGVLSADLSQLNIYYAYVCDAAKDNAVNNILFDAQPISVDNTNASIDLEHTKMFSVANVGNGYDNLSNLIDNDNETAFTFPLVANLGGATIAVNTGKTVNPGQQLVMLTNKLALGLGVSLGEGLEVTTWLNGKEQEKLTNWQVLNADVISTGAMAKAEAKDAGGKGYVALTPTKPFDNVRVKQVKVVSLLENMQIYSLAVRDLVNDDGTIDTGKDLLLDEDKTLDEKDTYMGAKMIFHRTFNKEKWNSLILPVDMTAAQVESAFGTGTEVSRFNHLEDNWIYFTPVTEDNGVLIHKNIPYIIKPTKEPLANTEYTVGSSIKTIEGPVYIATGISYTDETATLKHQDDVYSNGMIHYGSYVRQKKTNDADDFVPMGAYMLNNGDMVHTAKNHYVKGYRCWLEETTPSGKTLQMAFTTGDNNTTGIKTVEEQNRNDKMGIYSISGVRMNSNNADNLPKGMYIVNNKKVFVK